MPGTVEFELHGGVQPLVVLPVRVNGKGPFAFVLDTGAGTSLVTPELARDLSIEVTDRKEGRGAGGVVHVELGFADSFDVDGARVECVEVAITDELHRIGTALGTRLDGNLGYNFLKDFRLTLDYERGSLRLQRPNGRAEPAAEHPEIPFELAHPLKPLILVQAHVNGRGPYSFAIDTGASSTVIAASLAKELDLATEALQGMTGAGGTLVAKAARLDTLALDHAVVRDATVVAVEFLEPLSAAIGAPLDGVIGYNFLREFKVVIDYPNSSLTLR